MIPNCDVVNYSTFSCEICNVGFVKYFENNRSICRDKNQAIRCKTTNEGFWGCYSCDDNYHLFPTMNWYECRSSLNFNCSGYYTNGCDKCNNGNFTLLRMNRPFGWGQDVAYCQNNCSSNCLTCVNGNCGLCAIGYHLLNNQCLQCMQNCKDCAQNVCYECVDGFTPNQNGCVRNSIDNCNKLVRKIAMNHACYECAFGFYPEGNSCLPCANLQCDVCSNSSRKCFKCRQGFTLKFNVCYSCNDDGCVPA